MVLLHVGAVFQYDSAIQNIEVEKTKTLDINTKLLELNNNLLADQGNKLLNNPDNKVDKRTSREVVTAVIANSAQTNKEITQGLITRLSENKTEKEIKTILPVSYIKSGAMYIVPILIAFLLGVIALFISKTSHTVIQTEEPSVAPVINDESVVTYRTEPVMENLPTTDGSNETVVSVPDKNEILGQLRGN